MFGPKTTAREVLAGVDVTGRRVVMTGGTAGIGLATARALVAAGAEVWIGARDGDRGRAARDAIVSHARSAGTTDPRCETFELDLASVRSVDAAVRRLSDELDAVDVVIGNAGVYGGDGKTTADDVEWTVGVCHLGHFALVTGLLDHLRTAASPERAARVVMVASESHRGPATLDVDRLWDGRSRMTMVLYGQAKLCNVLFARELDRRERARGVRGYALHPGTLVATEIGRHSLVARIVLTLARPFAKSVDQGAATSVYCATHPALEGHGGGYYDSCRERPASAGARDDAVARRLWAESERMLESIRARRRP